MHNYNPTIFIFSSPETQVRVVFDYTAQQPDELSIKVGEILEVLSKEVEEGWWKVCNDCAYFCMYICIYTVHMGKLENDNLKNGGDNCSFVPSVC